MIEEQTDVCIQELMLCLDLSKNQIGELEKQDIVIKSGRNKYRLVQTLKNHRRYIKRGGEAKPSATGEVIDFNVERARKTKAEADRLERLNARESGEYIALEAVKSDISDAVGICAKILGSLKLNIARIAPQIPNRALDLIDKEQAKMLTAIIELDESYQTREVDIDDVGTSG